MIREKEDASTKMLKQQETIRNEQAFEKYHLEVKKKITGIKILADELNSGFDTVKKIRVRWNVRA